MSELERKSELKEIECKIEDTIKNIEKSFQIFPEEVTKLSQLKIMNMDEVFKRNQDSSYLDWLPKDAKSESVVPIQSLQQLPMFKSMRQSSSIGSFSKAPEAEKDHSVCFDDSVEVVQAGNF